MKLETTNRHIRNRLVRMSTPCTLFDGFHILRRRQKYPRNHEDASKAVDILGIVDNISTRRSSSTPSRLSRCQRSQIWLVDDSLKGMKSHQSTDDISRQLFTSASFTLYGASEVARVDQEQIKAGDIIRFNRVALKNTSQSMHFRFSSQDPEPGISWFRLGCINGDRSFVENRFDGDSESRTPANMTTCKERIGKLVKWFVTYHQAPYLSASNTLPTRKRLLSEIESTVGTLSNIKVTVTKVHSEPGVMMNTNCNSGKRKRRLENFPPIAFASVTDQSEAIMSFVDVSGRFLEKLRSAKNRKDETALVLTNVSTEYYKNLGGLTSSSKDIVLVPTWNTCAHLLSEDKSENQIFTNGASYSDVDTLQTRETIHDQTARETSIVSKIINIRVNGVSLNRSRSTFSEPSKFLAMVLEDGTCFRDAIIDLDGDSCYRKMSRTDIPAGPDVLKILCGSLEADELKSDDVLCKFSMGFMQNLVYGQVVLRWTLEKKRQNVKIVKVVLHQIPT